MACLFCGKDIGPLRLLRDREFCSSGHRQSYHERLGKALGQLSVPEAAPTRMAGFSSEFPVQEGNSSSISAAARFGYLSGAPRISAAWPVSVAPTLGGSFRPGVGLPGAVQAEKPDTAALAPVPVKLRMPRFELAAKGGIADIDEPSTVAAPAMCERWMPAGNAEAAERFLAISTAPALVPVSLRMPAFELAAKGGIADRHEPSTVAVPPLCERWMPAGNAEAAERFLAVSKAPVQAFPSRHRNPSMSAVPLPGCYVRRVSAIAEPLAAEPAAIHVAPVMDSRPALRNVPLAQLRFAIHAVEDMGTAPAARTQPEPVGRPAPAAAGPEPMPAESMPRVPAFAAQAIPSAPALRLPQLTPIARPLTLGGTVAPPAAMAVESMPQVALAVPQAIPARLPVRKPTLAHFQPAQEPSDALAAPVVAPGPMAVESMPSVPPRVVTPAIAPAVLMGQPLRAPIRAEFTLGKFREMPSPAAAAPAVRRPDKAALEPLTRIATHPAGTQPERPKPEIPQPGLFPLEFFCQRITSLPSMRLEWHESPIGLLQQPFQVRPALRPFAEYGAKSRKLLPFEEIFASQRKDGEPARVKLGVIGKIAATIMVGVALWGGARMANLSGEALRARVAKSERTVTAVAEVRRTQTGSGPVARLRRAIADRAATEVTDTFASGMEAWGAGSKTWASGWQHSPEGYVKTGDMALFRPSLKYTDYRMEFYGQIEEKSMGWVVRAQDKKNYYAMKFKVIEPGLRPIIAMVHYQVTNGKRGHIEETPLSVMVHNNQPYHVSVDVRGNHFVAAIEGEPVESWTDDAPRQGGVGFFSDAGERARLYWMKIARNQDWLGRFCAYLSGDSGSGQQIAELWGPEPPHDAPVPVNPHLPDLALAAAGASSGIGNSPRRAKTSKDRRSEGWIS